MKRRKDREEKKYNKIPSCGGLAPAISQAPIQQLPHSLLHPSKMAGENRKTRMKSLVGQNKDKDNLLPTTIVSKTNPDWGI